jgi:hypothetical protein
MTDMISAERDSNATTTSSMTKKSCNSLHGSNVRSLNDAGCSRSAVATDYNRNSDKMDAAEAKGDRPMSAGTLEPFAKVKSRLNVPTAAPGFLRECGPCEKN